MKHLLTASLFFSAALASSLSAGAASVASTPGAADTSQTSDAMQIYLVVHDKHDKPVLDLKPEELNVTDNGSPVRLNDLRLINGTRTATSLVTFVFDPFPEEKAPSVSKDSGKISNAREAALKILSMLAESGFQFSVFNLDSRLHLQQAFTPEISAVQAAIEAATGPLAARDKKLAAKAEKQAISIALNGVDASGARVPAQQRLMAQSDYTALRTATRIAQDSRISMSLSSILALAQAQQDLNGRKTLIYISGMQQATINDAARRAINSIIGSANQAGIAVDVVDTTSFGPHGSRIKMLDPNTQGALVALNTLSLPGGSISIPPDQSDLEVTEDAPVDADLQHLALATGGTYLNGDGQRKSLQQLIGDMTSYYAASFIPKVNEFDGKFHPVAVKPIRSGLKIRTQTGYVALPPRSADGSRPQPFEMPLIAMLKQAPLPSDVPFRAAVLNLGEHPEGTAGALAIEIPVESVGLQKDPNAPTYVANPAIVAYIKDEAGAIVEHFSADSPQRLTRSNANLKNADAISFERHFVEPPGKYTMEVLVFDHNSGKAGAQRIPFEIAEEAAVPSLSKLVLVRRTDPVAADDDPNEPLRQGKVRVTPNLSGALPLGDSNVSVFLTAHADPHAKEPAKLELRVMRDGQTLGSAPIANQQAAGSEYFSLLSTFSVNPPRDGAYQVEAILTQGGKTAAADASFTLTGVEADAADTSGNSETLDNVSRPAGALAITVPANPLRGPSPDELKSLLADATHFALDYWNSLPNFTCEDINERFIATNRKKNWEHRDTIHGVLTYYDHEENWDFVDSVRNGYKYGMASEAGVEKGIASAGLFGGVIRGLFRPASKAEIVWQETGVLGSGTVQVFKYHIARENSNLSLRTGPNQVIIVGYHGLVYIDSATHGVRRITETAEDVPRKFPIHAASVSADYDYVSIGGQDYLVPIGAQVILKKGPRELDLNQIRFRNFHRFGSTSRILAYSPEDVKQQN